MANDYCKKKLTESGKVINGGSRERALGGASQVTQLWKSNRISLDFGLTSNKDQSCIGKICFVFLFMLCYQGMCRFCVIFGRFGEAWPRFAPLHPPLKVMAIRPWIMRIYVYLPQMWVGFFEKGASG